MDLFRKNADEIDRLLDSGNEIAAGNLLDKNEKLLDYILEFTY
jgi:hypothetical protein